MKFQFFLPLPGALPAPQPRGQRAIRRYSSPVQHLPHLDQGHQATFMLCPANHAALLGEQLLAGGTDRLINPSMRCSTWRGNGLTKSNRQVQLWVCPRFEPPTPHLCISYAGREPVFLLSFIPSASCRSNSFTILSPSPCLLYTSPSPRD